MYCCDIQWSDFCFHLNNPFECAEQMNHAIVTWPQLSIGVLFSSQCKIAFNQSYECFSFSSETPGINFLFFFSSAECHALYICVYNWVWTISYPLSFHLKYQSYGNFALSCDSQHRVKNKLWNFVFFHQLPPLVRLKGSGMSTVFIYQLMVLTINSRPA